MFYDRVICFFFQLRTVYGRIYARTYDNFYSITSYITIELACFVLYYDFAFFQLNSHKIVLILVSFIVPTFDTKVTEYLCSGWVFFLQTNFDFLTGHF